MLACPEVQGLECNLNSFDAERREKSFAKFGSRMTPQKFAKIKDQIAGKSASEMIGYN